MSGAFDRLCSLGPVYTGRVLDLPLPVKGMKTVKDPGYPSDAITVSPELAHELLDMMFEYSRLTLRPKYSLMDTYSPSSPPEKYGATPYKVFVYRTTDDPYVTNDSYNMSSRTTFVLTKNGFWIKANRVFTPPADGGVLGGGWMGPGAVLSGTGIATDYRVIGVWASDQGVFVIAKRNTGVWGAQEWDSRGATDALILSSLQYPMALVYVLSGDTPRAPVPYVGRTLLKAISPDTLTVKETSYEDTPTLELPKRLYYAGGRVYSVSNSFVIGLRPGYSDNVLYHDLLVSRTVIDPRYFATYKDFLIGVVGYTLVSFSERGMTSILDPLQSVSVPGDPRFLSAFSPTLVSAGSDTHRGILCFGYRTSGGTFDVLMTQELERSFVIGMWKNMPGVPAICDVDLCFYDFDLASNSWIKIYEPVSEHHDQGVWDTGFLSFSPGRRLKLRSVALYGYSGFGGCDVTVTVYASDDGTSVAESQGPAVYTWNGSALQVPISLGAHEWFRFRWEFKKTVNLESPPSVLFWRVEVESEQ